jgi:hypothetical protein
MQMLRLLAGLMTRDSRKFAVFLSLRILRLAKLTLHLRNRFTPTTVTAQRL